EIVVDHYQGVRSEGDDRISQRGSALNVVSDASYNITLALASRGGLSAAATVGYGMAVGTRSEPGLLRAAVGFVRPDERSDLPRRLRPALSGRWQAASSVMSGRR